MFRLNKTPLFFSLLSIALIFILIIVYFSVVNKSEDSSEQAIETRQTSTDAASNLLPPSISIETILTTSDLQNALLAHAKNPDEEKLMYWQEQILLVAKEAGYTDKDLASLDGEAGRQYLHFRGRRLLYDTMVQNAYRKGDGVESIIAQFPETADLTVKTRELFVQRDALIASIAQTLIQTSSENQGTALSQEQAQLAALRLWR
jgi:hypothetical protein